MGGSVLVVWGRLTQKNEITLASSIKPLDVFALVVGVAGYRRGISRGQRRGFREVSQV